MAPNTKENVIQEIGEFFVGLFDPAAKLYNSLPQVAQNGAVWGSTVMAAINKNIDASPAEVEAYIQRLLPTVDLSIVQGFMDQILKVIDPSNPAVPLTLQECIAVAQGYFKKFEGSIWGQITSNAASLFTILASPETEIQKIGGIITLVYHVFVRPHVTTLQPATNIAAGGI